MTSLSALAQQLDARGCDYELIGHPAPIRSVADAAAYFDVDKAAPTLVVRGDRGLIAVIVSGGRGRLDLESVGADLGLGGLMLAAPAEATAATGFEVGAVPLVGHGLPTVVDRRLLALDHVFGGSGDGLWTLKIAPADLVRMADVIGYLD